jgi:hypothetical protein
MHHYSLCTNWLYTGTWFKHSLPRPAHVPEGLRFSKNQAQATCFIVLFLFLIAPGLKRIAAFNKEGAPWYAIAVKAHPGDVVVSHCADVNLVMEFTALSADRQKILKRKLLLQSVPLVAKLDLSDRDAPTFDAKRSKTFHNVRAK